MQAITVFLLAIISIKTPETNLIPIITMGNSVKVMVCGNGKEKRIKDFQLIKQV